MLHFTFSVHRLVWLLVMLTVVWKLLSRTGLNYRWEVWNKCMITQWKHSIIYIYPLWSQVIINSINHYTAKQLAKFTNATQSHSVEILCMQVIVAFNICFRLIWFWLMRSYLNLGLLNSCLIFCVFTVGIEFRSQEQYTQTHQKHCYLTGVRVIKMMTIWLGFQDIQTQTRHVGGLPSGTQNGGSQMTIPLQESTSSIKSIQLRCIKRMMSCYGIG